MEYKVSERILNEVVDGPDFMQLGVIEADNIEEALKIAKMTYPNKPSLKIENSKVSMEFSSENL